MPSPTFALWGRSPSSSAPTVLSVNYALADVLGGGLNPVRVIGTNFVSGCTCTIGGTAAAVTFVNSTTIDVVPGARAAGSGLSVVVTNPDTQFGTLAAAFEYWTPTSHANMQQGWERPSYSVAGGNGTWTARVGGNLTHATLAPSASSGAPVFNGTTQLLSHASALNTMLAANGGTVAMVVNPAAAPTRAANAYEDPLIVTNAGNATFGVAPVTDGGTSKLTTHAFDGTAYRVTSAACTTNAWHSAISRFAPSGVGIEIGVDNVFSAPTAMTGNWTADGGVLDVGRAYLGASYFNGSLRALFVLNAAVDATFATKFHAWARQRHGVA